MKGRRDYCGRLVNEGWNSYEVGIYKCIRIKRSVHLNGKLSRVDSINGMLEGINYCYIALIGWLVRD